jgi:serine/threonine protein kinase
MLTGTTPFTGTSPLAIALKHSREDPRPPREWVVTIPPAIEALVLGALEKKPEDRPQNAAEFRRELYATADQLGLEHFANLSVPSLETLRSAGTETPSGRLVIDIERLREKRAALSSGERKLSNDTSESPALQTTSFVKADAKPAAASALRPAIARIRVFFDQKKPLLRQTPVLVGLAALLLLVIMVGVVAVRSSRGPSANVNATITPNAAPAGESPSPLLTPTPDADPSPQANANRTQNSQPRHDQPNRATANNNREKRGGKNILEKTGDTFKRGAKKIKKIFKNPF